MPSLRILALSTLAACSAVLAACSSGELRDQTGPGVSPGTVTFRVQLPPTQTFCDLVAGCAGPPQHLSIATTAGNWLPLSVGLCAIDCSGTCVVHPCDLLCPIGTAVAVTQVEQTWDGSYFPSSTCGGGATPCTDTRYMSPGRYLARLCATPGAVSTAEGGNQICTSTGPAQCAETMFDIPGPSPIDVALPAAQGN